MSDSRSSPRNTISVEVQLRRSGELNYIVNACDLSERGCKVEFVERPRMGEIVWIRFDGLASIESTVRWIGDFAVGLQFSTPLDPRVLELLMKRLQ